MEQDHYLSYFTTIVEGAKVDKEGVFLRSGREKECLEFEIKDYFSKEIGDSID